MDKRKGLWAGYKKAGPTLKFTIRIAIFAIIITTIYFLIQIKLGASKKIQEETRTSISSGFDNVDKKIDNSKKELEETLQKELENLYSRLKREDNYNTDNIEESAKRTFELAKNKNANLLIKKGYEKKGGFGTWFTPMWNNAPQNKFYIADFVGNLQKNRISVFITPESKIICQILTSDAKNEKISVDISNWKKEEPHLIIVQWETSEDWVELNIDNRPHRKNIPDLKFDILGPLLFTGIDFEGKYPAKLKDSTDGPKIAEGLKAIGFEEYKQENNN